MKSTLRRAIAPVAAAGIVGAVVTGLLLGNGSGAASIRCSVIIRNI